jgi:hypothetical protein
MMNYHPISHETPEAREPQFTQAPIGSLDELREFIGENLSMAAIYAQLGTDYAGVGDDRGLEYSILRLVAYTRAAYETLVDLKEKKAARP